MTRILSSITVLAALFFASNVHAQQLYDQLGGENYSVDVALSSGEYDGNLAAMAAGDGLTPGHESIEYSKSASSKPLIRACYPMLVWNGYQWVTVYLSGAWMAVSSASLNAYIQGVLGAQSSADNILGRIGRGAWPIGC